jgi:hypothetical protein
LSHFKQVQTLSAVEKGLKPSKTWMFIQLFEISGMKPPRNRTEEKNLWWPSFQVEAQYGVYPSADTWQLQWTVPPFSSMIFPAIKCHGKCSEPPWFVRGTFQLAMFDEPEG